MFGEPVSLVQGSEPVARLLEVELGTVLHIKVEELKIRMKSSLVGMDSGEYLIVKMPRIHHMGNVSSLFPKDKKVFVRYTHKGSVYGFSSVIMGSVFSPRSLLFLEYPASVEIQNHRAHVRYDCLLPARIDAGGRSVDASVSDIGKGGCRLEVDLADLGYDAKDVQSMYGPIALWLRLPGGEPGIGVKGMVRHVNRNGVHAVFGVEFGSLDEDRRKELYEYILEVGSLP